MSDYIPDPCFDLKFNFDDITEDDIMTENELDREQGYAESNDEIGGGEEKEEPPKRFESLTDVELTSLEGRRNEKSTAYATTWGLNIVKSRVFI